MSHVQTATRNRDKEMVPRVLLLAVAALVLSVLALVSFATVSERPLEATPAGGAVADEMILRLIASNDGQARVLDLSGAPIAELTAETGGFVSGVARALAFERAKHGIDPAAPARLVQFTDGRIALFDDLTGQRIELMGFGQDNLAAFARLFNQKNQGE